MININTILENKAKYNRPFLLKPIGKQYIWGGRRLIEDYNKDVNSDTVAETWECSTHNEGLSIVSSGYFKGQTLKKVLEENPEFLGTNNILLKEMPILIKFIDAHKDLSVQVHPDDQFANKFENQRFGKAEAWYILEAKKNAQIIYGFNHNIGLEELRKAIYNNDITKYLKKVQVFKNNVFFINPGTVHAIGEGVLVVEIQQNSNMTYRLYDYNRKDANGKLRELHIDKALSVANLHVESLPSQKLRVLNYIPGCATEVICKCRYFTIERIIVNTELKSDVNFASNKQTFKVFVCIDGCGTYLYNQNEALLFFKGDCLFVPANSVKIHIHGKATFLCVYC